MSSKGKFSLRRMFSAGVMLQPSFEICGVVSRRWHSKLRSFVVSNDSEKCRFWPGLTACTRREAIQIFP